jgi:hypothetical protein
MNARRYSLCLFLLIIMSVVGLPVSAQGGSQSVSYGNIHISFPITTGVQVEAIEGNPITQPDVEFLYAHYPEHIRFSFLNYMDGYEFRLPYLIEGPQILVYSIDAMREFGYDYVEQANALESLLLERPDLSAYVGISEVRLPFVPWVNSGQMMRSHAQYVDIAGVGSGIRYVTRHSQEADHLTDRQVFYTFQGIMKGGTYYVSAVFPVKTGVLPEEIDTTGIDWNTFGANYAEHYLPETFAQIASVSDVDFNPSLNRLDALIQSITFDSEMMVWQTYTDVPAGYQFQFPVSRQICVFESSIELIYSGQYYQNPDGYHCALFNQANPISIEFTVDDTAFQAYRAENYPESFTDYQEQELEIEGRPAVRISGKEVETLGVPYEVFRVEHNDAYLIFKARGEESISLLNEIIATLHFVGRDGS